MVLESISRIIKIQLPAYLKKLPLPETIGGFARLTVSEWLRLLPLLGILALLGYLTIRPFLPKKKKQRDSLINLKIQKENPKVVNEIDIEDLRTPNVCYCRCWRSKTESRSEQADEERSNRSGDEDGQHSHREDVHAVPLQLKVILGARHVQSCRADRSLKTITQHSQGCF
uniref:CDGSH iron-sulfur domain-containing protein 2 n=1 Tax=Cyprinus carpio carpio TaxID=630221 RepID=A0A9J8CQL4_CYPCA